MKKNRIISCIISLAIALCGPVEIFSSTTKMPDIASKDPDKAAVQYSVDQNYLKLHNNYFMPGDSVSKKDFNSVMSKIGGSSSSSSKSGTVTREEAAVAIVKALGYSTSGASLSSSIKDKKGSSSETEKYLAIAAQNGLIKPVNVAGKLYMYPNRSITRKELAVILYKISGKTTTKKSSTSSSKNLAINNKKTTSTNKSATSKKTTTSSKTATSKKTTPSSKTPTTKKPTTSSKTATTNKAATTKKSTTTSSQTKKPKVVVINPVKPSTTTKSNTKTATNNTKKTTPTKPAKPTTPTKPVTPVKPVNPTKPVKPVTPTKPTTNAQTSTSKFAINVKACPATTESVYEKISGNITFEGKVAPKLYINSLSVAVNVKDGSWSTTVKLHGGANTLIIKAVNAQGKEIQVVKTVTFNPTNPQLHVLNVPDTTDSSSITVMGDVKDNNDSAPIVTINGVAVKVDLSGLWSTSVKLSSGENKLTIVAKNRFGKSTTIGKAVKSTANNTVAAVPEINCTLPDKTSDSNITVAGTVYNTTIANNKLKLDVNGMLININNDYSFSFPFALKSGDNVITITVSDEAGNKSTFTKTVTCETSTSANSIISFKFEVSKNPSISTDIVGKIYQDTNTIFIDLPIDYTFTPTILVPDGATISPDPSVAQDFFQPVHYTVTGKDGSKREYIVNPIADVNN